MKPVLRMVEVVDDATVAAADSTVAMVARAATVLELLGRLGSRVA